MFNQKKTQNKEVTPLIKYSFSRIIETHLELIIKIKSILYENEQKFQIENILNMFKYLLGNNIHLSKNKYILNIIIALIILCLIEELF